MKDETCNRLYKLATIFDKEKVQEKQELVNELSKVGNRAIHELAARKGWQEGSEEKILAHSIFGGLLSSLAGGKAPGPGPDHQRRGRKCRGGRDRRKQHREQCEPWGDEVE